MAAPPDSSLEGKGLGGHLAPLLGHPPLLGLLPGAGEMGTAT